MESTISESKLRILQVASELFMERGYEVVKLKEIADILNIKQPSLYYHFSEGKEQIYFEVVELEIHKLNQGLIAILNQYDQDNLREILYQVGIWAEKNMSMSPVIMNKVDIPQLSDENQQKIRYLLYTNIFQPIKGLFDRAITSKEIREVNTSTLAGIVLSVLEAMDDRINIGPDKRQSWQSTVDLLLDGMLPRK